MFRLSTLALLLSCTAAAADTLAPVLVEADVTTDSTEPQVGDVVLEEYTGSHQRIEREQLQQAGASLGQLLSAETGVQHRTIGAEGSYSSITIRGATSAQTPVYWDGMQLNGAANPNVDLSDLELLNLDSVDIYRGTAPVQLGAGGMGGAIELRSPQQHNNNQRFRLQLGSFGSESLQLGASSGEGIWQAHGVLSLRQADNNFQFINDNGTPLNTDDDQRQKRRNAQFERLSFLGKLSYRVSDTRQYSLSIQANRREQGVPEWRNFEDNQANYQTDSQYLQLSQLESSMFDGNWNSRLGFYRQWRDERYDDQLSQVGLGAQLAESKTDLTGVNAYLEHLGDLGTLAIHFDARHEELQSDDLLEHKSSDARRNSLAMTGQYAWFSEDERWLVTPALRLNTLDDSYNGALNAGNDERTSQSAGLQFGVKFQADEKTTWQANLGQHHREPSFFELFGNQGLFIGNDELEPEKGLNLDISLARSFDSGDVRISAYGSWRDDLIATVFSSQGIGRSVNIGEATVAGLEISASRKLTESLQIRANWTLQDAINHSPQVAFKGKQLPGQARSEGLLRLSYQHDNVGVWLESQATQDKFYDTANLLAAEDQLQHNAGASWKLKEWEFTASIQNLSDENTEDFNGFAKPGRNAHISVAYQLNN